MSSCPPEYAAQVDAVQHGPFSSAEAPIGRWFKNNQGNVCLTLPDSSYYYFNVERDWYHLSREPDKPDHECASVYISPPGVRYYNPPSDNRDDGSSFIGVHWRTEVQKICWRDEYGMLSFMFRKLIDPEEIPLLTKSYIAVFTNQAGIQRVVEVDKMGIYKGKSPWVLEEIAYWLANLVPVNDVDGPEWRGTEARSRTPPADRSARSGSRSSSLSASPSIKRESIKRENMEQIQPDMGGGNIKTEGASESGQIFDMGDVGEREGSEQRGHGKSRIFLDAYNSEEEELRSIPAATGTGQACMRNLLAARQPQPTPVVLGSRISKNAKGKFSPKDAKPLRNGSIGFQISKASSQKSK